MRCTSLVPLLSLSLIASACGGGGGAGPDRKRGGLPGDPIAEIGGEKLTVEEIQRRIDEQSPFVRARYADEAKKKEFLESQVRFEVLAQEAIARGYDQDPEVQDSLKKVIVQKLTREEFEGRVKAQDIKDDELKSYYDAHKGEYDKPEMVRASAIVIGAPDKATARAKAEEAQKKAADKSKLEDRNFFRDLVAQYSTDDATKRAGGDIRYVSRDEAKQQFGDAAVQWLFAGETINEVSPVVEAGDRLVVFKRTGKRQAITRNFDQVKNQIKNVVFREKRQAAFDAYIDELKKKHGVTVFADKLGKVKVNAELPGGAGAMPTDPHGHGAPGLAEDGEQGGEGGEEQDPSAAKPSGAAP